MAIDLLLGLQWGDEGKGKIVDVLTSGYDIIARFQGGPNAGHTLEFEGIKHVLHTIPSGIFHKQSVNVVGNGVVIDPVILAREIDELSEYGLDIPSRLLISRKAHLILPTHRLLDATSETAKGKAKIGSTLKGIGPTYMDKTGRNGLRVGDTELPDFMERYRTLVEKHLSMLGNYGVKIEYDLEELEKEWFAAIDTLKSLTFIDSEHYLNKAVKEGKKILAEGAQGAMLDVDFGTYPFVTSSNTMAAGACTGLGVAPGAIGDVLGIFKAYTTRVGSGPFPTEDFGPDGERMCQEGREYGATTGRRRRCGWLDLPVLKYACMVSGVTKLMMMKADVLSGFDSIKVCTHYDYMGTRVDYLPYNIEEQNVTPVYETLPGWRGDLTGVTDEKALPKELKSYIKYIEDALGVPVAIVSVGPDRKQTIMR